MIIAQGVTVDSNLLDGMIVFALTTGTALAGWALVQIVRLAGIVAGMVAQQAEQDRRLDRLEHSTGTVPNRRRDDWRPPAPA